MGALPDLPASLLKAKPPAPAQSKLSAQGEERFLDPERPIVTKTDLEGRITYANRAFVDISGFRHEELIGQPHSIVRHPDMPAAAFNDLWRTVAQGHPWRGVVKNRTKEGNYYWVDAYVTELTQNGQRVGFMSVRGAPTRDKVAAAEALYAQVRAGSAKIPATRPLRGAPLMLWAGVGLGLILAFALAAVLSSGSLAYSLLGASAFTALVLWLWLRHAMVAPINSLDHLLKRYAEGDLSAEVEFRGARDFARLFSSFRSMQVNLRAIISDVIASASLTQREAHQLYEAAQHFEHSSQLQADQVAASAAAMQELAVSVNEIASMTDSSATEAAEALRMADEGERNMQQSATTTASVVAAVEENQRLIAALSEAVENIGNVTTIIDGIAKRTNLLALNASIEAARAGEHGRGFAVVAGEVAELAAQTQSSTQDISRLITQIGQRRAAVSASIDAVRNGVAESVECIAQVGKDLEHISLRSRAVATNAEDVRHMLEQQSAASNDVANIMERMSSLTDDNLASASKVETAASQLEANAGELNLLVRHFRQK